MEAHQLKPTWEGAGVPPAAWQRVFSDDEVVPPVGLRKCAHGLERACVHVCVHACTCVHVHVRMCMEGRARRAGRRGTQVEEGGGGGASHARKKCIPYGCAGLNCCLPCSTTCVQPQTHTHTDTHTLSTALQGHEDERRKPLLLLTCPVVYFEALSQPIQRMEIHPASPVCNGRTHRHRPTGGKPVDSKHSSNTADGQHSGNTAAEYTAELCWVEPAMHYDRCWLSYFSCSCRVPCSPHTRASQLLAACLSCRPHYWGLFVTYRHVRHDHSGIAYRDYCHTAVTLLP
jgi:hypothetical protein